METLRKGIAPALGLAALVATVLIALSDGGRFSAAELANNGAVLLLYGWPEYILLASGHYWLLRRWPPLRRPGYAAGLGGAMALVSWRLGLLLQLVEQPGATLETWRLGLAVGCAGAAYGWASAALLRCHWLLT